jgi:hypothetical protein
LGSEPVIDYERRTATSRRPFVPAALWLVGVQFLWFIPVVFGLWVVLCNNGLIQNPVVEVAAAVAVVLPSLAALLLGAVVVARRRREEPGRVALAAGAMIGAAGWVIYVAAMAAHELLHPSPFPCL